MKSYPIMMKSIAASLISLGVIATAWSADLTRTMTVTDMATTEATISAQTGDTAILNLKVTSDAMKKIADGSDVQLEVEAYGPDGDVKDVTITHGVDGQAMAAQKRASGRYGAAQSLKSQLLGKWDGVSDVNYEVRAKVPKGDKAEAMTISVKAQVK